MHLLDFPNEILFEIVGWLNISEVGRLSTVCHQLKALCYSDRIWKRFFSFIVRSPRYYRHDFLFKISKGRVHDYPTQICTSIFIAKLPRSITKPPVHLPYRSKVIRFHYWMITVHVSKTKNWYNFINDHFGVPGLAKCSCVDCRFELCRRMIRFCQDKPLQLMNTGCIPPSLTAAKNGKEQERGRGIWEESFEALVMSRHKKQKAL